MKKPNCVICDGTKGVKVLFDRRLFGLIQLCADCRKKLEKLGWEFTETKRKPVYIDRSQLPWKRPVKVERKGRAR